MEISSLNNPFGFDVLSSSVNKSARANSDTQKAKEQAKIAETAEDFEAFFITKMMESMYAGVSTDGMFGGGNGEKMYRSLLLNEYGKVMAQTGTVGVKDDIMRSIIQMQEQMSQSQAKA